jgi:hypothetical protein
MGKVHKSRLTPKNASWIWVITLIAVVVISVFFISACGMTPEQKPVETDVPQKYVAEPTTDTSVDVVIPTMTAEEIKLVEKFLVTPSPVPSEQRLVMTYYFYWYDAITGGHLEEGSGIKHHMPEDPLPSWRNVDWHKKEIADMTWAGIDVVLPVYWGFENPADAWSYEGLDVIAKAWFELKEEGINPPNIGMFFDTTIINFRDLTTQEGKEYFYANFRDFFSRIPREQWALINGHPVVFLFTSDFTAAVNQSSFEYVYGQFEADFGVRPYIVREVSWDYPILRWEEGERVRDYDHAIQTENSYLWAASIHGFVDWGGVAAIGPGFDDRGVPGRGGTVTDREGGEFYRRGFEAAIASGKPLLVIETWNEFHEGSGISETIEFGRYYLDLTRELAEKFHHPTR